MPGGPMPAHTKGHNLMNRHSRHGMHTIDVQHRCVRAEAETRSWTVHISVYPCVFCF